VLSNHPHFFNASFTSLATDFLTSTHFKTCAADDSAATPPFPDALSAHIFPKASRNRSMRSAFARNFSFAISTNRSIPASSTIRSPFTTTGASMRI